MEEALDLSFDRLLLMTEASDASGAPVALTHGHCKQHLRDWKHTFVYLFIYLLIFGILKAPE